jgi:hypothetical protein
VLFTADAVIYNSDAASAKLLRLATDSKASKSATGGMLLSMGTLHEKISASTEIVSVVNMIVSRENRSQSNMQRIGIYAASK